MAEKRFFGIFEVCYDTRYGKDNLNLKKIQLFADVLQRPDATYFGRCKKVYEDRSCNEIKLAIIATRNAYNYGRKFSRSHRFKTAYFIHETNEAGLLKLSKKEQQQAEALLKSREEAIAKQEAEEAARAGIC